MVIFTIDIFSAPSKQVSARLCTKIIYFYQILCSPLLKGHIQCRYCPSCSEFSKQAVLTHGFAKGIFLSLKRIFSCTKDVPLGTMNPVPSSRLRDKSS